MAAVKKSVYSTRQWNSHSQKDGLYSFKLFVPFYSASDTIQMFVFYNIRSSLYGLFLFCNCTPTLNQMKNKWQKIYSSLYFILQMHTAPDH